MLIVIVCLLYLECATVTPADVDMCWIKLLEAWRWLKKILKAVALEYIMAPHWHYLG